MSCGAQDEHDMHEHDMHANDQSGSEPYADAPHWNADGVDAERTLDCDGHQIPGSGGEPLDHSICKWIQGLTRALRRTGDTFEMKNAQVAILRNKATYFSSVSQMDSGNVYNFANVLYQLHVPFDVVTEDTICLTPTQFKVSLEHYRAIFIPHQHQFLQAKTWAMLWQWLSRSANRVLCVGLHEGMDRYLNPSAPPTEMVRATGVGEYRRRRRLADKMELVLARRWGNAPRGHKIVVDLPRPRWGSEDEKCPVGTFAARGDLEVIATLDGEPVVVAHQLSQGSRVYSCGFPLGFCYMWYHSEPSQPASLNALFGPMVEEANVHPSFDAPPNLGVHVSRRGKLILFKERYGWKTDELMRSTRLGDSIYTHVTTQKGPGNITIIRGGIKPRTAIWAEKIGEIKSASAETVEVSRASVDGSFAAIHLSVKGRGRTAIALYCAPQTWYRIVLSRQIRFAKEEQHKNGNLLSSDAGTVRFDVDLNGVGQVEVTSK